MTRFSDISIANRIKILTSTRSMPTFRMEPHETVAALELIRIGVADDMTRQILKIVPPKLDPLTNRMTSRLVVATEDDFVAAMRAAHALGRSERG